MVENEEILKLRVERYQQRIFALVLYLIGGDMEKTYDIVTNSFVETIAFAPDYEEEDDFLVRLARATIEKSWEIKTEASFDESLFKDISPLNRKSLFLTRKVLLALPFKTKTLLLLRDQLHLSFKDIATIFRISDSDARAKIIKAQVCLREEARKVLRDAG